MKKLVKSCLTLGLLLILVALRAFENQLFYDPFLHYFKGDHLSQKLPDVALFKLCFSYFVRYSINSIVTLIILTIYFKSQITFKKTSTLFFFLYVLLISLFLLAFIFHENLGNLILFYIRRFIIQPMFLIILFPLFYFTKKGDHLNN